MRLQSPYQGTRLSVFHLRPLSLSQTNDGSQAILLDVLRHFSRIGVYCTVHTSRRRDLPRTFDLFPNVTVRAELPFNEHGPDPYRAPPFHLAEVIDTMRAAVRDSDVLYVHDNNLRFNTVGGDRPLVSGVCDLVYGNTLTGVMNFRRDRLIAVSDYVSDCLREVFRRFRRLSDDMIHVVPSGFAMDRFRPQPAPQILGQLGLPDEAIPILYPHRPGTSKGIMAALDAVQLLKERLPADVYDSVRLLVPMWDNESDDEVPGAQHGGEYAELRRHADDRAVGDKLHLHRWIPRSEMPQYYAAGAATLCVGTFAEAFGNVHVESLLCGTPVVLSRVAAQRTTVPEELVRKVDPGDNEGIADHLAEVIKKRERTDRTLIEHLRARYGMADMLRGWERALLDCEPSPEAPLVDTAHDLSYSARLRIPPWAASLRSGYYHDYTGYCTDTALLRCLPSLASSDVGDLLASGLATSDDIRGWLAEGLVVGDPIVATGNLLSR